MDKIFTAVKIITVKDYEALNHEKINGFSGYKLQDTLAIEVYEELSMKPKIHKANMIT